MSTDFYLYKIRLLIIANGPLETQKMRLYVKKILDLFDLPHSMCDGDAANYLTEIKYGAAVGKIPSQAMKSKKEKRPHTMLNVRRNEGFHETPDADKVYHAMKPLHNIDQNLLLNAEGRDSLYRCLKTLPGYLLDWTLS